MLTHGEANQKIQKLPPRRGTKRTAVELSPKKESTAKKTRRKHVVIQPDLREIPKGGTIFVIGQGDVGQLGLGEDIMERTRPSVLPGYDDIIAIAAGGMHNVCLRQTGEIITFGCNDEGALGRDTSEEGSETQPATVDLPGKAIQVTAGDSHSAALLEDGRVFAWGSFRDTHGTMGLTLNGNERFPIEMLPGTKVAKLASGADHLVLLSEKGLVYTCGCPEQGQLGRLSFRASSRHTRQGLKALLTPDLVEFKISKKAEFDNIWAGTYCTFVKELESDNIYVFGLNNYYQIGLDTIVSHYHPKLAKTFNGKIWTNISSGQHHTVALDKNGQVHVLGRKEYGRLGLGSDCTDAEQPTVVPKLNTKKCIDIGTGGAQSFAVTDTGELWAWGMGTNNQLGTGNEDDVEVPVLIKGKLEGKKVVRVCGGGQHTLLLAL